MSTVTKVYNPDGDIAYYFINGVRSDAFDDRSVLEELLGEDFQEYWLLRDHDFASVEDEVLSRMESAETESEFEALVEEYPHLIADV